MKVSENEIIQSILTDNLDKTRSLLAQSPDSYRLIFKLLQRVQDRPLPLGLLKSRYPPIIHIPTSFTCQIGCKMCNAGFSDKTSIYPDRKHLLPDEFDKFNPWIETASHINLAGIGETLESPHIPELLKKISKKISMITTSGVPLNKNKARLFMEVGLKYLNFSFDGDNTLGHGSGNPSYSKKFWEKVDMVQRVKSEAKSKFPILILNVSINRENIDELDDLLSTAHAKKISYIDLVAMFPINDETYSESIFPNLDISIKKINKIISIWREKGLEVTIAALGEMKKSLDFCHFVDNYLIFNTPSPAPHPCCGPLDFPLDFPNMSKEVFWGSFPFRYLRYLHYYGNKENWPVVCKNCNLVNLNSFADSSEISLSSKEENKQAHDLYREASESKNNENYEKAEKGFLEILGLNIEANLKGKIYFQLGLIKLQNEHFEESLNYMKLAVGHYYSHGMAFAFLYLLFMLLENPEISDNRTANETYMEQISRANGLV